MFVPVEIDIDEGTRASARPEPRSRIEVELRGGRIVIDGDINPRLASAVVAVVRSRS